MSRKMEEKGSEIRQRLGRLRLVMEENGIDAYLVETADFHQSEYVGDYFKSRAYLSGFTGSAGTLLVGRKEAALWTDGRYFVQAAGQLEGTGIRLMRSGQEGVPTVLEFLEQNLPQGGTLGFDGRTVSGAWWEKARERLGRKQIKLEGNLDLAGQVWEDRPPLSARPVWILDEKYAGKSAAEKLKELRRQMTKEGADVHILTSLDDIAWLLNLRGDDVKYNPVFLANLVLEQEQARLFVNRQILAGEPEEYLKKLGVEILPYEAFYDYGGRLEGRDILLERDGVKPLC